MATELNQSIRRKLLQMRGDSRRRGKSVPDIEDLISLIPEDMKCPACGIEMQWRNRERRASVVSIQHDDSGAVRLMCCSCNSKHAARGDFFYEIPRDHRLCMRCDTTKHVSEFYKATDRPHHPYCKACNRALAREWVDKNRERVNHYQNLRRRSRKTVLERFRPVRINGIDFPSMTAAAAYLGISKPGLRYRIKNRLISYELLPVREKALPSSIAKFREIVGGR